MSWYRTRPGVLCPLLRGRLLPLLLLLPLLPLPLLLLWLRLLLHYTRVASTRDLRRH